VIPAGYSEARPPAPSAESAGAPPASPQSWWTFLIVAFGFGFSLLRGTGVGAERTQTGAGRSYGLRLYQLPLDEGQFVPSSRGRLGDEGLRAAGTLHRRLRRTIRQNQDLELARFNTVAIPFYATVDPDEKVHATFPGLTKNPQEYFAFLRKSAKPDEAAEVIR
jgi:hypothetical protein